jgi:hypothetical protein
MAVIPSQTIDFNDILEQAALSIQTQQRDRPSAKTVLAALLHAEKHTKQQRISYPLEALLGRWQLGFTAPRKAHFKANQTMGTGVYIPQFVPAQISFMPSNPTVTATDVDLRNPLTIANQIQLSGLRLQFTGVAQYLGKKNLLVFEFTRLNLALFDRTIYQQALSKTSSSRLSSQESSSQPAKLPFFAFFWATEHAIAARGRGGGVALWVRRLDNEPPHRLPENPLSEDER